MNKINTIIHDDTFVDTDMDIWDASVDITLDVIKNSVSISTWAFTSNVTKDSTMNSLKDICYE